MDDLVFLVQHFLPTNQRIIQVSVLCLFQLLQPCNMNFTGSGRRVCAFTLLISIPFNLHTSTSNHSASIFFLHFLGGYRRHGPLAGAGLPACAFTLLISIAFNFHTSKSNRSVSIFFLHFLSGYRRHSSGQVALLYQWLV